MKGTTYLGLKYEKSKDEETGYSYVDWAGDLDDRHFTSGYIFLLVGAAVSWLSKKQSIIALSTAEAEYVALSLATQEALWLRRLLKDIGMPPKGPTVIHEDNQGAIAITLKPAAHART